MTQKHDIEYYSRREREERSAAEAARDSAVRDAHFMMAERYADRAWSLSEQDPAADR